MIVLIYDKNPLSRSTNGTSYKCSALIIIELKAIQLSAWSANTL